MMVAQVCKLKLGEFIHTLGDAHLYNNHIEQAKEQISRAPNPFPTLVFNKDVSLFDLTPDDIKVENYEYHPAIKAPVAV